MVRTQEPADAADAASSPAPFVEAPVSYNRRDLLVYALGVGAVDLCHVYENADEWRGFALAEALHIVNQNASNLDAIGRRLGM